MVNLKHESNKRKYEGEIFSTLKNGDLVVIEYSRLDKVTVEFLDTGYRKTTSLQFVLDGRVKDRLKPSVYGIGVVGDEVCTVNGVMLKEYKVWSSMLQRCYDKKLKKQYPSYEFCLTEECFNYFTNFKEWCNNQIGFSSKDEYGNYFALDKDILVKGNKLYSPETCCFVPNEINNLLSPNKVTRGDCPMGVSFHNRDKKYQAYLSTDSSRKHLGYFLSVEDAFKAYKKAKEYHIKEVANKWKDQIDPRVYEALMKYEVEITD